MFLQLNEFSYIAVLNGLTGTRSEFFSVECAPVEATSAYFYTSAPVLVSVCLADLGSVLAVFSRICVKRVSLSEVSSGLVSGLCWIWF